MPDVADLRVRYRSEGMNDVVRDAQRGEGAIQKFSASANRAGQALTLGLTLPLVAAGAAAFNWASDVDEAANKANKIFGDQAAGVLKWSEQSATAFGLSQAAALDAASNFGQFFKLALGPEQQALVDDFSFSMVELAGDLASFNNVSPEEALMALRSGLSGETEPLRQFGVFLNEATVQAKALELGIWDGSGAMTEQQKILARHAVIMEQTADAQGDYADTAGGAANMTRTLRAQAINLAATFGKVLLPIGTKVLGFAVDFLKGLEKISPEMQRWVLVVAAGAAALGPLLLGLSRLAPAFSLAGAALGFLLSPIGLVIAAAGALAFLFRDDLIPWLDKVKDAFASVGPIVDAFSLGFEEGLGTLAAVLEGVLGEDLASAVVNGLQAAKAAFDGEWGAMWDNATAAVKNIGTFTVKAAVKLAQGIWEGAQDAYGWLKMQLFGDQIRGDGTGGPEGAAASYSIGDVLIEAGLRLAKGIWEGATNLWDWFKNKIGVGDLVGGDASGGPEMDRRVTIGDVLVDAGLTLAKGIWQGATSLWEWFKRAIGVGSDGTFLNPATGSVEQLGGGVSLGDVAVNAALKLASTIWEGAADFGGWLKAKIDAGITGPIELGEFDLTVPRVNIVLTDDIIEFWLEEKFAVLGEIKAELNDWRLALKQPKIEDGSGGAGGDQSVLFKAIELFVNNVSLGDIAMANPIGVVLMDLNAVSVDDVDAFGDTIETLLGTLTLEDVAYANPVGVVIKDFQATFPDWSLVGDIADWVTKFHPYSIEMTLGQEAALGFPSVSFPDIVELPTKILNAIKELYPDGISVDLSDLVDFTVFGDDPAVSAIPSGNVQPLPLSEQRQLFPDPTAPGGAGSRAAAQALGLYGEAIAKFAATVGTAKDDVVRDLGLIDDGMGSTDEATNAAFRSMGAIVTNVTLALESRAQSFAGQLTRYGALAGEGFANGLGMGLRVAQAAAAIAAALIPRSLSFSLFGPGYNAGVSFGSGLGAGIAAMAGYVAAQAAMLALIADLAVRQTLGIRSPSSVARERGRQTGQGFALGLADMRALVAGSARSMVAMPAGATAGGGGYRGGGMAVGGGGGTTYINAYLADNYDWNRLVEEKQRSYRVGGARS